MPSCMQKSIYLNLAQKLLYLGIFGLEFENFDIWNQPPRIFLKPKFRAKMKIPKFRTKNVLFRYFWAEISKCYCHIWNHCPQICLIVSFGAKIKILKFETQKCLICCVFLGLTEKYIQNSGKYSRRFWEYYQIFRGKFDLREYFQFLINLNHVSLKMKQMLCHS